MTSTGKLLRATAVLIASLSQTVIAGKSDLGTLEHRHLPSFLTNNPIINGYPWGSKSSSNADSYTGGPNTGVVRSYEFTVARGTIAPDGFTKDTILFNGKYPGPLIEANWGDTIEVTINNAITDMDEGTAVHWHGINQRGNEWNDGVPGVSQCPIPPGSSYTYRFRAAPYGSTWYHSHYSSQYAGGLWGPLVIYGPNTADYDIDLGPVTLNDYYHRDYYSILEDVMGTDTSKVRPASDNNLINGKMNFNCDGAANSSASKNQSSNTVGSCVENAELSKFKFTSGKKHRLRLVNTGTAAIQKFSIDNHTMTVIANDFIPIEPYETTIVTLAVGQRSDVIVEATGKPTDVVWMRSFITSGQCTEPANNPLALAVIYYEKANTTSLPKPGNATAQVDNTDPCANDDLSTTVPSYQISAGEPTTTLTMAVNVTRNATGSVVWTIDESSFRADLNNPLLLLAKTGNVSYPYSPELNVYNVGSNKTIRVVINNLSPTTHPWHLHGHEQQVLAVGKGEWDGTVVRQSNPQRRDIQLMPAKGYMVVQWQSDNPGVWPFHCHIAWHLSAGLYANILERPDEIKKLEVPSTVYENCRNWAAYTGEHLIPQIDAGL